MQIINYNKINLQDDAEKKKVIIKHDQKYPERILNSPKTTICIIYAATKSGKLLPMNAVYKLKNLNDSWTLYGS